MSATLAEVLAGVLLAHSWVSEDRRCMCRWRPDDHIAQFPDPPRRPLYEQYSAHLAAEQSRAVAVWLRSEDVREVAARADARSRRGVTAKVNDTDREGAAAALDAVAGLCGGER